MNGWNRRKFLKLGVLGTAGAALEAGAQRLRGDEPRPWNEGSGRALRKYRDPIPTVCRACTAHCGLLAFRDGDRVVQLQAANGSPTNQHGLCPRAWAGLERVYDPDRVLKPLRRDGPRGSGRWKAISWGQALAEVGAALAHAEGERVLHVGQDDLLLEELRPTGGWTRVLVDEPLPGRPGPGSGEPFYGTAVLPPDLGRARCVLLFGARLLDDRAAVPAAEALVAAHRAGTPVVLFDALSGVTGSVAEWVPVAPGTEAAVAWGLARLVLEWGFPDDGKAAASLGDTPEALRQALAPYTPEVVAKLAGISEYRFTRLADQLRAATPTVSLAPAGSSAAPAAALLNHLLGAVESTGGFLRARGPYFVTPLRPAHAPDAWFDELAAGRARAGCCLVSDANPVYDAPGSSGLERALADPKRTGFLAVLDTHLTETARLADVFLPLATPFESWGLAEGCLPDGRPYLLLQQPATNPASEAEKLRAPGTSQLALVEPWPRPLGEARSLPDVLLALGRGRGGGYDRYTDSRAYLEDLLQRSWGPGSLGALRRRGIWVSEEPRPADRVARASLARFVPPPASPGPASSLFLVGYASSALPRNYGNSRRGHEIAHGGRALVNRETGKRLGLEDGDRVVLKTAAGEGVAKVLLVGGLHPGAVALPDGLGHRAGGAAARAKNQTPEGEGFDGPTAPGDPVWWEEAGPGVSYRALVPFRLGPDGARDWGAVPVAVRKV